MDWLVTFKRGVAAEEIRRVLTQSGCAADDVSPIPLDDAEQVVSTAGPADLPRRLAGKDGVLNVHPDSSMTLY